MGRKRKKGKGGGPRMGSAPKHGGGRPFSRSRMPQWKIGESLTDNLDALHEWERGEGPHAARSRRGSKGKKKRQGEILTMDPDDDDLLDEMCQDYMENLKQQQQGEEEEEKEGERQRGVEEERQPHITEAVETKGIRSVECSGGSDDDEKSSRDGVDGLGGDGEAEAGISGVGTSSHPDDPHDGVYADGNSTDDDDVAGAFPSLSLPSASLSRKKTKPNNDDGGDGDDAWLENLKSGLNGLKQGWGEDLYEQDIYTKKARSFRDRMNYRSPFGFRETRGRRGGQKHNNAHADESKPKDGQLVGSNAGEIESSNVGRQMLERMGWKGGGLGPREDGLQTPVDARIKRNRRGVG